jgi:beta-xylosidase
MTSHSFIKILLRSIYKLALKTKFILLLALLFAQISYAQDKVGNGNQWGDLQNGRYKNPILNADYSDPDIVRVGKDFYMVCSDFHFMGMQVLKSRDLINWQIVSQIYRSLDISPKYNSMEKYGGGSWAPSIRHHNGRFYVYFCTPDEGLYMSSSNDPEGKWSPLAEVQRVSGWEDPCPFWDSDGQAYLGHSKLGAGPIIIHRMSQDGTKLLDEGKLVYSGPTAEGTKIYKRNGYYYLIIPEGGVATGYQTALRSKNIYGPYERKVVLEQGTTKINGPHQGGLVDLESGESWFLHFQDQGTIGRVAHLQPVRWVEDWPLMGEDYDGNGIGEPVSVWNKPNVGRSYPVRVPQSSDEFNGGKLGLQWQWNHNPISEKWSIIDPKSILSLGAVKAPDLKHARNTLTQKLRGNCGILTTLLMTEKMKVGQRAGLCLFGNNTHEIGLMRTEKEINVYANNNGTLVAVPFTGEKQIFLRINVDLIGKNTFLQYSSDGKNFIQLGKKCELSNYNYWKGVRPGLFSYNTIADRGIALFDWFRYNHDGPSCGLNP